jgi:heme A synthase
MSHRNRIAKMSVGVGLHVVAPNLRPNSPCSIRHSQFMSKETLFALSLFPYLGFLWFLTKSAQTPKLALRGFYFLLVFVVVTIPAGIYAKTQYNAELANVDWLHGAAESFLTLTNILVVIGFQQAIQAAKSTPTDTP